MKAVGLVTEYNPFHNGHIYHIQKSKEITNADVVIAVMSGNFVQRGIPAIADKWERTKVALENGVDIVIELPIYYALQPAHIFANGAINLLSEIQVNDIAFGAENPNIDFINLAKNKIEDEKHFFEDKTQTFASSFANALESKTGFKLEESNDILAFTYAKAIVDRKLEKQIKIHPIARKNAAYKDFQLNDTNIASATAIRLAIDENKDIARFTPMNNFFKRAEYEEKLFDLLFYRLSTDGVKQLKQIYQMNEGLEYRIKDVVENGVDNFPDLLNGIKSKRYTASRIHRLLVYSLLNIKVDQMQAALKEPYLRLLGYTNNGQKYLNEKKREIKLPMITHVDLKLAKSNLRLDYKAGVLYNQLMNIKDPQDIGRIPISQ
ncbi:MAG: nucleotidyltransferase [Lactobacillaceae bacterium]|jgi:predicted nucleotidyltransferase|nr:nucleotidyltransferase [Lactobacillaceae bacterium]